MHKRLGKAAPKTASQTAADTLRSGAGVPFEHFCGAEAWEMPAVWEQHCYDSVLAGKAVSAEDHRLAVSVAQEWLEQSCCQRRIEAAILRPIQDCQARTRPAPGPHQARTSPRQARLRCGGVGFPTSCAAAAWGEARPSAGRAPAAACGCRPWGRRSCWPGSWGRRSRAHLQALLARLAEDSEAEVAVVALLDRGLPGAPAAEGLWRSLGLALGCGLWRGLGHGRGPLGLASFCLALGALVVAVLAELFARCPADRRAHRGDVAQQEVEVVAAPVVKDHGDGLGRLGCDVAGVAQRPKILPGAVAVVELLLGGLEASRRVTLTGLVASPGEVVVGQLEKVV